MLKRVLSIFMALCMAVTLLPTTAFATSEKDGATNSNSTLTPDDHYYALDGKEESNEDESKITLSKTAVENEDGTYTITLSASVVDGENSVEPQTTEVIFVIDGSSSMNYCAESNPRGHNHKGGNRCKVTENNWNESRWMIVVNAIEKMVTSLENGYITCKFVVFWKPQASDVKAKMMELDYLKEFDPYGETWLSDGVNLAVSEFQKSEASKKVMIIVADGEATDGYPKETANKFIESGGEIYTVGFAFTGKEYDPFTDLASDEDHVFTVENSNELTLGMEEIKSNIQAIIRDPLGEYVSLEGDIIVEYGGSETIIPSSKVLGDVITWSDSDGLTGTVTLTYTVKIDEDVFTEAGTHTIYFNGDATFNYSYNGVNPTLAFPQPRAAFKVATLEVSYVDTDGNTITVKDPIESEGIIIEDDDTAFTTEFPEVGEPIIGANGQTYYVTNITEVPGAPLSPQNYEVTITLSTAAPHTVTFNAGDHGALDGSTSSYTVPDGSSLSAEGHEVPDVMPNSNYTFTGWQDGDGKTYTSEEVLILLITEDMIFTAQYRYTGGGGGTVTPEPNPNPGGVADPDDTGVSDLLNTEDHIQYLFGYPEGTFGPENNMTRAEVAQMFYNLLRDRNVAITTTFNDVSDGAWYAEAVNTLASMGVVSGVGNGEFQPNRSITRAEFTTIAMRFSNGALEGENIFSDVSQDDWFYDYVVGSIQYGWINGYPDGTFHPNESITRAEVTAIVNHMLGREADEVYATEHYDELNHFTDLETSHWGYYHIVEATNDHDYTKSNDSEIWTEVN